MSKHGFCLAAGVLLTAPAFVSGAETSGAGAGEPVTGSTAAPIDGGRMLLPVTTGFISPDGGREGGGGGGGQGASAAPVISTVPEVAVDTAPPFPQNQCFCIQPQPPSPFNPSPYYLGQLTTVSPKCASLKMQMKFNEKPVFEQVVFCEELGKCWKKTARYAEKGRGLGNDLLAAREKYGVCCPGADAGPAACDEKCRKKWETKVKELESEIEGNEKASVEARGKCVHDFIQERMRARPGNKQAGVQ